MANKKNETENRPQSHKDTNVTGAGETSTRGSDLNKDISSDQSKSRDSINSDRSQDIGGRQGQSRDQGMGTQSDSDMDINANRSGQSGRVNRNAQDRDFDK